MPDGMTVRVSRTVAYEPDALVYCGPRLPDDATEAPDPVVVVEILSPGTKGVDTGVKLTGYFSLSSVRHYLIVNPDRRIVTHHRRDEGDLIASRIATDGMLRLDPPGLQLAVADLFPEP